MFISQDYFLFITLSVNFLFSYQDFTTIVQSDGKAKEKKKKIVTL